MERELNHIINSSCRTRAWNSVAWSFDREILWRDNWWYSDQACIAIS